MKFLLLGLLILTTACSRVGTGEVGIVLDWSKQVQNTPVVNSVEVVFLDSMITIDATQIRVPITDVKAKDNDEVLFQDIDAQITYNITPQGAVDFYKLTKEIEHTKDGEEVLGIRVIEKEGKNALVKTITKFKASQINTDKALIEETLKVALIEELNTRFPKTFEIVDVNIDQAMLDPNVEKVLQAQALIESEKKAINSRQELQIKQSELLDGEITDMKKTAQKAGISVADLMKYKNDKERNRVLSELARNNGSTQVQVKE